MSKDGNGGTKASGKKDSIRLGSKATGTALSFDFTSADPPKAAAQDSGDAHPGTQSTTYVPEVVRVLSERFPEFIRSVQTYANEFTVLVDKGHIQEICRFLREEHAFNYLVDLGGADRFVEDERFEVFYNIVSIPNQHRIRLKVRVDEDNPVVPTVTGIYPSAGWNEREVWDMYGITFEGHEDMRRIYLPEDFEYHPLRKEFPLLGIPGSLPLPPQTPEGPLTLDPFAAAHGSKPVSSFEEPLSDVKSED